MVTSNQMRRVVPILLALVLVVSGLCGGLCFAQTTHSCCHEKSQCDHPAPAMQSHQAPVVSQLAPVILTELGLKLMVGGLVAPEGPLTDAVRATLPVKLFEGVTVITEVFPVVAP